MQVPKGYNEILIKDGILLHGLLPLYFSQQTENF